MKHDSVINQTTEDVLTSLYLWLTGIDLPTQERVDALNKSWLEDIA